MPQDEYSISGFEIVSRTVKPHGNGARVGVPKDWVGEEATVIRRTKQDETAVIGPVAALMYDSVAEDGATLERAMEKVVRFQSFRDINTEIASDFRACLNGSQAPRNMLLNKAESTENAMLANFYREIGEGAVSKTALKEALSNWL